MTDLAKWQNFYVIVGSSAGALIGLQFVVLSVITNGPGTKPSADAGHAFATPTIVNFGVVLALSALMSAPWPAIDAVTILWGLVGLWGIAYALVVTLRMRKQNAYKPEFEDWLFYSITPFAAYTLLAASAAVIHANDTAAFFAAALAVLLLLFAGIHNAWDTVTYHVFYRHGKENHPGQ